MFEQRLPDLLHAEEGAKGRRGCERCTGAVRCRSVVVKVIISSLFFASLGFPHTCIVIIHSNFSFTEEVLVLQIFKP